MATQTASPTVDTIVRERNVPGAPKTTKFASPVKPDGNVTLKKQYGDAEGPVPAPDAKAFVEARFADVDAAWAAEGDAMEAMRVALALSSSLTDDEMADERAAGKTLSAKRQQAAEVQLAVAGGQASGHSQVIAYLLTDTDGEHDFVALGEQYENDRRQGDNDLEAMDGWTGPGEITAIKRMQAVDYFRTQAAAEFKAGDSVGEEPSAAAHYFGRAEAFQNAADNLSSEE